MTVYVVQDQRRYDKDTGTYVPKFDLSPAAEHGEIRYLLSPTAAPFNSDGVVKELRETLADFSDDDHLLLVGNPILIGWSTAIAADFNDGSVSLLQWSGKDQRYISVVAQLFDLEPETV